MATTIFGYVTGNGGNDPIIYAEDGVVTLTRYQQAFCRYFCYPEEPTTTYRLISDPDWILLPFGTIITPTMAAVPIPGQIGMYLVNRPRGQDTNTQNPPQFATTPQMAIPSQAPVAPAKPRRRAPKKTNPDILKQQLEIATTLADVAALDMSPEEIIKHPEFQSVFKKLMKEERKMKFAVPRVVKEPSSD